MTDPAARGSGSVPAGGWFPDPLDRYDSRYHNGTVWTADVAVDGERFVDPMGIEPGVPSNGRARASQAVGILAVAISWMPFLFVPGLALAVVALWLGWSGLARSRTSGHGRASSIIGLTSSGCAVLASIVGGALTFLVLDVVDTYQNPNPHTVEITACQVFGSRATAEAVITNDGTDDADFVVRIDFVRPGTDNAQAAQALNVRDLAPGASRGLVAGGTVDLDTVECVVGDVTGPRPFGLDL